MPDIEPGPRPARRAVQYLRMSAEHQRYSIARQTGLIADYALRHGFEIVRTYADPGKSGLSLKGRVALQQLLADTLSQTRDFDAILVLDVSRWGRFQDPDQAAHYEFICKQAGAQLVYCDEPFNNDGSVASSVIKILKRLMAGEYSRELSAKMFTAHMRHARQGNIQGQPTPYGVRRQIVGHDGKPKYVMKPGEQKALHGDRVRWVLGPDNELKTVRTIFEMYSTRKYTMGQIAQHLNKTPGSCENDWDWTACRVRGILKSEVYIGNYLYNRRTSQLQAHATWNDESLWVRASVLPPIVPKALFQKAEDWRRRAKGRPRVYTDNNLLKRLNRLLTKYGYISEGLIDKTYDFPASSTYWSRFGSLENACREIGHAIKNRERDESGRLWTDESRLDSLRQLYEQNGYVSRKLISETRGVPSGKSFYKHFGSMDEACARAGIPVMSLSETCQAALAQRNERRSKHKVSKVVCVSGKIVWSTYSTEEILDGLRRVLEQHGHLSIELIRQASDLPPLSTIYKRFGTLLNAFELAGWSSPRSRIMAENNRQRARKARMERERSSEAAALAGGAAGGQQPPPGAGGRRRASR